MLIHNKQRDIKTLKLSSEIPIKNSFNLGDNLTFPISAAHKKWPSLIASGRFHGGLVSITLACVLLCAITERLHVFYLSSS